MVMRPAPPPVSRMPRLLRFHPLCFLRGHRPEYWRLNAAGEKWAVYVYTCLRCNRVVGDSHAAKRLSPHV